MTAVMGAIRQDLTSWLTYRDFSVRAVYVEDARVGMGRVL